MSKLAILVLVVLAGCQAQKLEVPRHSGSALPHERQEKLVNRMAEEAQELQRRLPKLREPAPRKRAEARREFLVRLNEAHALVAEVNENQLISRRDLLIRWRDEVMVPLGRVDQDYRATYGSPASPAVRNR